MNSNLHFIQHKIKILNCSKVWKEGPSLPKALASGIIVEDIRTRFPYSLLFAFYMHTNKNYINLNRTI